MVLKKSRIELSVGGAEKISLWRQDQGTGDWIECPNLPKSFLPTYLKRGFVQSPPEFVPDPTPEIKVEETQTFAEAIASGKLDTDVRIKKKIGQSKKV